MVDTAPRFDVPAHRRARPMPVEPGWHQRAIFYEMLVQAGLDSNGDGHGDLRGLASKLDYLQWLGVDCLWLPPSRRGESTSATTTRSRRSTAPSTTS